MKKSKKTTYYKALFVLDISILAVGIAAKIYAISIVGLVF